MKNNYLLTVIIPVYNLQEYIETCMDSLINQSYKNFQIIVIDDASTDDTFEILCSYRQRYSNILLKKNTSNHGASFCRNLGLQLTSTKYVMFLDGDDWIDSNCIEKAINRLEENDTIDVAIWNIYTVYSRSNAIRRYYYEEENIITGLYALRLYTKSHVSNVYISPLLGNKIFRTALIKNNNLVFHGTYYEDDVFMFYIFLFSNKVQLLTDISLYYLQRDSSLMHSFSGNNIEELFQSFSTLKSDLISKKLWTNKEVYYYSLFEKCLKNILILIKNSGSTDTEERAYLYQILQGVYSHISINEYVKFCDLSLFML